MPNNHNDEYDGLSTGYDTHSDTGHAKANIVNNDNMLDDDKPLIAKPSVKLRTLKNALDSLNDLEGFSVQYQQLNVDTIIDLEDWISLFPQSVRGQALRFSKLKSGNRRQALVAEISYQNKPYYIIDIERDEAKVSEKFSMRIIYTEPNSKFGLVDLYEILAEVAQNMKWCILDCSNITLPVQMIRMNHSSHDTEKVALKIKKKLIALSKEQNTTT